MQSPEECPPPVYDLMRHCWELKPSNFDEVSTTPNSMLEGQRGQHTSSDMSPPPPPPPPPPLFRSIAQSQQVWENFIHLSILVHCLYIASSLFPSPSLFPLPSPSSPPPPPPPAVEAAFHSDKTPGPANHLPPPISCNASRPLVPHHTPSSTATNGSALLPE